MTSTSFKKDTPLLPLGAAMFSGALFVSGNGYAAAATPEATLETITVKAKTEQKQDGAKATMTRVGKIAQDPHDVPQAITTVTRSVIEEQQAGSLREALRNVAGLSFNAAEGGRSGDNMMLRGFYTFGDMYLDGVRDTAQYNRELFNLEQVDVLRGAAAMLFGRGQAGGVINQVSKTPSLYGESKISAAVGTREYQEIKADINQRLGDTTALRLNFMNRDEGSWRKNPVTGTTPEIHRTGFAPSLAFGLGTEHEITLSHLYLKTADRPDYGVPFNRTTKRVNTLFPASSYWGVAGTFDDSTTNISTASHLWRIAPGTELSTKIRQANYQRSYWASAPGNATNFATGGSAKTRQTDTDNLSLQSDFSTHFKVFGMRHELLVGGEYLHEKAERWSLANLNNAGVYYKGIVGFTNSSGQVMDTRPVNRYSGDTYSAYLQDTVEFLPHWKATIGVRRDDMKSDYVALSQNATTRAITQSNYSGNFKENSYRAGVSWQPNDEAHYYLSWSDSFSPTADLYQLAGAQYPAERSKVSEIGAKWQFFEGDLAFRTALYQADKVWERNTDLESTAAILTKKRQTRGIEFELAGRINTRWEVFAGVSFMDPIIKEVAPGANPNFVGQTARNSPKMTGNLWTTYQIGHGWKVGAGLEAKSKRFGYVPSSTVVAAFDPNTIAGYVRWDAMVAYEQPKYTVKLNIQNMFNKVYYDALYDNGGFTVPGLGRRIILSTDYKF